MIDTIELTEALIRCASVTPRDEGAQKILADALEAMGFECHHLPFGEGDERVENLFARLGTGSPHVCYGGHTDVVPSGPESDWNTPPFEPTIIDGTLYGRGASDMKGSVAAFVAAISAYLDKHGTPEGSISLLITGDEEAIAKNGTVKVLEWMKENDQVPDVALVGEPTNPSALGQEIKVGRRGSLNGKVTVNGKQGHVAYQHMADNPLPRMAKLIDALSAYEFDQGTEFFAPTNLEVVMVKVENDAENVIPGAGQFGFNIRFNETWSEDTLTHKVKEVLDGTGIDYDLTLRCSGESFLTDQSEWTRIVKEAVDEYTGGKSEFTTSGGTSDARFITNYCPVVEFGPVNETIHQINENADVEVLEKLTQIYTRVLELYFS